MRLRSLSVIAALSGVLCCTQAMACGGELPTSCDEGQRNEANSLLTRAVAAVNADRTQALQWFTEESHGYRTVDLYVFCIGPDHMISAHPDPKIRGSDAATLADVDGTMFGATMLREARSSSVSDITYKWPRPGETKAVVKHTMFTRAADQICAVGYYE